MRWNDTTRPGVAELFTQQQQLIESTDLEVRFEIVEPNNPDAISPLDDRRIDSQLGGLSAVKANRRSRTAGCAIAGGVTRTVSVVRCIWSSSA